MIVMNAGRAEQIGAPLEVYAQAGHHLRRRLHRLAADEPDPAQRDGASAVRHPARAPRALRASPRRCSSPQVDLIEPLGADTLVHGMVDGTRIVVRLPASRKIAEGRLPLRFDPARAHCFDATSGARLPA